MSVKDISDYAMIGDRQTAALVSRDGSIDWLCLPNFGSPACFAALVGSGENGAFRVAPAQPGARIDRRYREDSMILETTFTTDGGKVLVTDFMVVGATTPTIIRIAKSLSGRVAMRMDLTIRFDYGRLVPWVTHKKDPAMSAIAGPHLLTLRTPIAWRNENQSTVADFELGEGDSVAFVLTYSSSFKEPPPKVDIEEAVKHTAEYWTGWSSKCCMKGRWRPMVIRSLLTLKALTFASTGGIIAAPTTSIPEKADGARNWDYRFCWLRDATFTLLALMQAGYRREAEEWQAWLRRAVAGNAAQVQPLYGIYGDNRLEEMDVPWLSGFNGAAPVRVGNRAFGQTQLDNFGEVLDMMHQARRNRLDGPASSGWDLERALLEHLESVVDEPDRGIWETRGRKRHFTHSRVMMWVAFDRAVKAVEQFDLDGPVATWRDRRDRLHAEICHNGYSSRLGAFIQAYGHEELDASALLFAQVGFLPAEDPRMIGTVRAIMENLTDDGLIMRYDTSRSDDGLPPGEGVFLACSFWLVDNLVLQGRREEAEALFDRLLSLANDVGLLAEEYDPKMERQMGNFPQALSHLALVSTALNLTARHGPARHRGESDGGSPR